MKRAIIGLLLAALLVVTACSAAPKPTPVPSPTPTPSPVPAPMPPPAVRLPDFSVGEAPPPVINIPSPAPGAPAGQGSVADSVQTLANDRMIVRTAQMSLVVADVPLALDRIAELAGGFDGYVVSSTRWKDGEKLAGLISIRVPADSFNSVMAALRGMAVEVTREDTASRDVTEEYVDLTAKLHNLEATETQLLEIMTKAERVEDVLSVQRELSRTRGEIEQVKGRLQYLERTSATSLITVQLNESELGVNFTADKRTVKEGQVIRFEGQISGGFTPYSYEWDFGDGTTSTIAVPTHAYKTAGLYNVSLKVTDDRGNTGSRDRGAYIDVKPGWSPGPVASSAWNGLATFGRVLADIFIWVGIFSPVWIILGAGYWYLRRRKRKARS